jgi:hypothetical protein
MNEVKAPTNPKIIILEVVVLVCKKCGREMTDHFSAPRLKTACRSEYVMHENDYCSECSHQIMDDEKREWLKFLLGTKVIEIEIKMHQLKSVTVAKGARQWTIKPDGSSFSISEIMKETKL